MSSERVLRYEYLIRHWSRCEGECHRTLFSLVFFIHLQSNFTSHSLPTFLPYTCLCYVYPLMLFMLTTNDKEPDLIEQLVTEQLIYWATDIPKQSGCGSSSPRSCAGTSSATTEHSHHSKFRTSRTRSTSRSASTARRPQVIARFLATTAARSPQPTASMR